MVIVITGIANVGGLARTFIIIMIIIKIINIVITGIANVGGLAGTQMPERVLSDAYEKGGKQMIGDVVISVIILIITYFDNHFYHPFF